MSKLQIVVMCLAFSSLTVHLWVPNLRTDVTVYVRHHVTVIGDSPSAQVICEVKDSPCIKV